MKKVTYRRRQRGRRSNAKRKSGGRSRRNRNNDGIENKHYAQITETLELPNIDANATTTEYFHLGEFPRAFDLAKNFKFYRAKKVLWKYQPIYNIFGEGATGDTVPYIYTIMNRTQEIGNVYTIDQIQEMGGIPQKFSAPKVLTYTPNWCTPGLQAYKQTVVTVPEGPTKVISDIVSQGLTKHYGWLMTPVSDYSQMAPSDIAISSTMTNAQYLQEKVLPAQVLYNGHLVHVQQEIVGAVPEVGKVTCTVVWEFKGPKTEKLSVNQPLKNTV